MKIFATVCNAAAGSDTGTTFAQIMTSLSVALLHGNSLMFRTGVDRELHSWLIPYTIYSLFVGFKTIQYM